MDIGVIGTGNISAPLGRLWAAAGHRVCFGSRHPGDQAELLAEAGGNARVGSPEEAAAFGEVVFEAIPFGHIPGLPADAMQGKPLVSAANLYPERDGEVDLGGLSHTEWVQAQLPGVRVVKGFNMMQARVMQRYADGGEPDGFAILLAGDDAAAKDAAATLVRDAKFEPVDAGPLAAGRHFQSPDAPLYDTQTTPEDARRRLDALRADRG